MYISKEEWESSKESGRKLERALLWGTSSNMTEEEKYNSCIKIAWVEVNGERKMIGVHNQNLKGYELHDNYPTIKIPPVLLNYDKFIRWCTTFDL